MKRAKIMLLTIAVIASVGGVLAFKAQRFTKQNVWCNTNQGGVTCTKVAFRTTLQDEPNVTTPCKTSHEAIGGIGVASSTSYYTTNTCPALIRAFVTTEVDQ